MLIILKEFKAKAEKIIAGNKTKKTRNILMNLKLLINFVAKISIIMAKTAIKTAIKIGFITCNNFDWG
jgi:hypothetical protein